MSRMLLNVFVTLVPCIIGFPLHIYTSDLNPAEEVLFKLNSLFSDESNTKANENYFGHRLVSYSNNGIKLAINVINSHDLNQSRVFLIE